MRFWACTLSLALGAVAMADPEAFLTYPDIHGDQVVFTAEGDLWLADVATGAAHRLTSDPGVESQAHFSPDGSQIAFTASYDGAPNVYVMPTAGGTPKRLTFDSTRSQVVGWTPDGANVLFRSQGKIEGPLVEQFSTWELFSVPVTGGQPKKVAVPRASFAALNNDGHTLAFVPTSNEWMNWFRYEAGEADKVWLADLSDGKFTQLTQSKGVDTQPTWLGNSIYFVSERSGVRNLWQLDPQTKHVKQVTNSTDAPVRHPSSDGKRVVFEVGAGIEVYDPATGQSKTIPVQLNSDHIHSRAHEVPIAGTPVDGAGIGPTGKRVTLAVRGHLVTVPAADGPMHSVTGQSGQRIQNPTWSPDGKTIAYVSDASGEEELYLVDAADGATPKQLTKGLGGENGKPVWSADHKQLLIGNRDATINLVDATTGAIKKVARSGGPHSYDDLQSDFAFSPDSKWVAYSAAGDNWVSRIFLYNIASGVSTLITDPTIDSASAAFSPDGKYLYALQGRSVGMQFGNNGRISHDISTVVTAFALASGTPTPFLPKNDEEAEAAKKPEEPAKETKVDIDGLADRYFDMQVPPGKYMGLLATNGRLLLQTESSVMAFDIASKSLSPLAPGSRMIELSSDNKKLLVAGGNTVRIIDPSGPPTPPNVGALKLTGLTVTVDPKAEWRQMFEETWRVGRDFFYDPNTHGVNWKAVHTKYAARLPLVATRDDLTHVLADMISEFNTGHCYVGGPSSFTPKAARPGLLGADLAWDSAANAYRITRILKGDTWSPEHRSPLGEPGIGVKEGDYIFKVRGNAVSRDVDPAALLVGSAGLTVSLTVNSKPTEAGARNVLVVPIANESDLRLEEWINGRKKYVEKASGGQIGYVYVGDMEAAGANQFARQFYPNSDKPGIIVDVRGNGGGNISGNLLNDLSSKVTGYFTMRSGGTFWREHWAPLGQVVAVTNEFAFSDGEYFSEFFKRLKIGPLVGHRTGGGEVGSGGGYQMTDGGSVFIPNYGAWVPGEWVIEGRGAVPDFEVDQDPTAVMAGKDPQLDKAISIILENLKKHPYKTPEHPPFPVKLGGSRG